MEEGHIMPQWKEIQTTDEWNQVLEDSQVKPILVLKHSTTCPVSAAAFGEYEHFLKEVENDGVSYILVKVIESRPVSNQIASDLEVKHESPQAILIKEKNTIWNASHWKITKSTLHEVLQSKL